jgi:cytochrome b561
MLKREGRAGAPMAMVSWEVSSAASFWAVLHDWVLPLLFLLLTHLAAMIKHHFFDHHPGDVGRMLL